MLILPYDGHTLEPINGPYTFYQIDFVESLDKETIKGYKLSAYQTPYFIFAFKDDPMFADLEGIEGTTVIADFKNWVSDKDALMFMKPWVKNIAYWRPQKIMTEWNSLSQDHTTFTTNTIIYENDRLDKFRTTDKPLRFSFGFRGFSNWRYLNNQKRSLSTSTRTLRASSIG